MSRRRGRWRITLVVAVAAILIVTLPPTGAVTSEGICLICGERGAADAFLNLLLFAPFGFALRRIGMRPGFALAAGILLSLAVEGAQFFIPGRDSAPGDVLFNALGAWFGALMGGRAVKEWLSGRPGRQAGLAAACSVLVTALTGYLLSPDPGPGPHRLEIQPPLGPDGSLFEGLVAEVRTGGDRATASQRAHGIPPDVEVVFGTVPYRRTLRPLLALRDARNRPAVLFGPRTDDLVLQLRRRTRGLRLPDAELGLADVFPRDAGSTRYQATLRSDGERAACVGLSGIQEACGLGFSAASGWSLFYGAGPMSPMRRALYDGAWLAFLFAPLGFVIRSDRAGVTAGVAALASLLVVPLLAPVLFTPPVAWAGALTGLALGGVAGRLWRRRRAVAYGR